MAEGLPVRTSEAPLPPSPEPAAPSPKLGGRLMSIWRRDLVRRLLALVVLSLGSALLVMDVVRVPQRSVQVGEVLDRDIRATANFSYVDEEQSERLREEADDAVLPVFDYNATTVGRLQSRTTEAFEAARSRHADALLTARAAGADGLSPEVESELARDFLRDFEVSLVADDTQRLVQMGFDPAIDALANELLGHAMGSYVVGDRTSLPTGRPAIQVVRIFQDTQDEVLLDDFSAVVSLDQARKDLALYVIERGQSRAANDAERAALAVARAMLRPNFTSNELTTTNRRSAAREAVGEVVISVQRGTALAREGDVLTRQQVDMIGALQESRAGFGAVGVGFALIAFSALLFASLYQFGAGLSRKFSTGLRDLQTMAALALVMLLFGRLLVELAEVSVGSSALGVGPSSLYYMVPFCGGAMLVRTLINSETALLWIMAVGILLGVMMDQQVLFSLYFAVSGVTAVAAMGHTRERVNVLRAGVQAGLVQAGLALLINLVQVHLGEGGTTAAATQPLWDVGFAFLGGLVGGFLALGLVPVFELLGYVTDFKLLELANLNHPLLRQLMLRAPGTYHHSVTVASLCESAAESIGANALQTRVACYFHDIGKALQPRYFIENQGGGLNPHDKLNPHTSAQVIINHVVDGAAIARQYKLPQPILDGIEMHHGTGIIQYFYIKALEAADSPDEVDEAHFRYPGKKPNSRETGIMMLADKVEAAVRTLKEPSADNIRNLIQKIVNSAVTDGQFEECPLTIQELYRIVDAFTNTLLGIYHHRIEYPGMPKRLPQGVTEGDVPPSAIITLEMNNPFRADRTDPEVQIDPTDPDVGDPSVPQIQPGPEPD